jgi:membrane-associated phospholipid phosphatase
MQHPESWPVPWGRLLTEVAIAVSAYFVYFLVRGMTQGETDLAFAHGYDIVEFEKWLGIYHEHAIQDALASHRIGYTFFNWVYIYGHWPLIAVIAVWLLLAHPKIYRTFRNAILISGGIGLVIFAHYPVAPPRLLDIGIKDTITLYSRAYRVLQPNELTNIYAAMPSLHFGWDLLIGMAAFRAGNRVMKTVGVLMPVLMAMAVVATGQHFIVDVFAGGMLALVGLWAATRGRPIGRYVVDRFVEPFAKVEYPARETGATALSRAYDYRRDSSDQRTTQQVLGRPETALLDRDIDCVGDLDGGPHGIDVDRRRLGHGQSNGD